MIKYLNKIGGKVLASGSYGCIFKPAINCADPKMNSLIDKSKYITKLMVNKYAEEEYNIIERVKEALNHIENYNHYFLIDGIYLCKPTELTNEDLVHYKKCYSLIDRGVTINNINDSLDKLSALYIYLLW